MACFMRLSTLVLTLFDRSHRSSSPRRKRKKHCSCHSPDARHPGDGHEIRRKAYAWASASNLAINPHHVLNTRHSPLRTGRTCKWEACIDDKTHLQKFHSLLLYAPPPVYGHVVHRSIGHPHTVLASSPNKPMLTDKVLPGVGMPTRASMVLAWRNHLDYRAQPGLISLSVPLSICDVSSHRNERRN
jgi:hypothetical protein